MVDNLLIAAKESQSPLLMALMLGLVFALDPCALLTNVAAIGYLGKDIQNKYKVFLNGMMYTLGRTLSYGILGYVLMLLLRSGRNVAAFEAFLDNYGTLLLIIFMFVMGVLLIIADYIPWFKSGISAQRLGNRLGQSGWGAFLLGVVLSLGFCPTNAVIFFGMLVPLSATAVSGALAPFVFAFATALPVILVAWIFSFSLQMIGGFYNSLKRIGVAVRWLVGLLFIGVAIYLAVTTYWLGVDAHQHHECNSHQEHVHTDQ